MLQEVRAGRRGLDHGAVGREIAAKNGDSGIGFEGLCKSADDVAVPAGSLGDILPDRLPVHSEGVAVQHAGFAQFAEHDRQSAGVKKILHEILTGGHEG